MYSTDDGVNCNSKIVLTYTYPKNFDDLANTQDLDRFYLE